MNIYGVDVSPEDVQWAVNNGAHVKVVRRLAGLGAESTPRTCWLPGWSTLGVGLVVGAVLGMYVARAKPDLARKVIGR